MRTAYQNRVVDQTLLWVNGKPRHNFVDGECCPDFSCCVPSLFEPCQAERQRQLDSLIERYSRRAA